VGEHHDVAVADHGRKIANILLGHHASGGILRRVKNNDFGAVGYQGRELADIEAEFHLFAQWNRDGLATHKVDHGFVNGESWIGVDDLIPFFNERQHGKEDDGLTAWNNDNLRRIDLDPATAASILGNGF